MKMSDKIELNWTLNISHTFKKYDIFEALEDLFLNNEDVPEDADYPNYVIDWLETNLEDSVEEFLDLLDPMLNIDGEIDDDILDNKEFMKEFRQYLND